MTETIPTPPSGADWYTAIPKASVDLDAQTKKTLEAIQENMERLAGIRGEGTGQALITASDLMNETYLNQLAKVSTSVVNYVAQPGDTVYGDSPPPPTNLHRVTYDNDGLTAPWFHHIEWDNPSVLDNVYYIEVWCSSINDVGTAQRVAIVTPPKSDVFIYGIQLSVDYYYWIRSISYGFKSSTWVPNPDTQGGYLVLGSDTVGETIDGIMRALAGETPPAWDSSITYSIGDLVSVTSGTETRKYRCIAETTNNTPPNTTYWERFGILMEGEVAGVATVAIDGNLVVDGTILADAIYVTSLSSITANIGDITAGTLSSADWDTTAGIRLDLGSKWLKMGGSNVTAAGAAAGVFLGLDTSYKFYVGDGSTKYLKFDGTDLSINTGVFTAGTMSSSDWATTAGVRLDLTNKYLKMGGSNVTAAGAAEGIFLGLDTSYKFYIGDGSNEYIKYDGSNISISTAKSDGIVLKVGADLKLEGDNSNPGTIKFSGSSYNITLGVNSAGTQFNIGPSTNDAMNCYFGTGGYRFDNLYLYANNLSQMLTRHGTYGDSWISCSCGSTGNICGMGVNPSGTQYFVVLTTQYHTPPDFMPNIDSAISIGHSSYCFKNVYADAGVTSCSDRKWKKNVKTSPLGLDFINKLDFITWEWDRDKGKTRKGKFHGMLAQDVLSVIEEMGLTNDDFAGVNIEPAINPKTQKVEGENMGLIYEQFIAPLGRAIQELDKKINAISK